MSCLLFGGGGSRKSPSTTELQMDYMRNCIYESAFTYNTEKHFRNEYTFGWSNQSCLFNSLGDMNDVVVNCNDDVAEDARTLASKVVELFLVVLSSILLVLTFPFSLLLSLKFVSSFERLIVMRLGRAQPIRGPGTTFVLPCIDRTTRIDVRVSSYAIPPVQVITSDRGLVEMSVVVMAKIVDPMAAYCGLQDKDQALRSLSYNTVYNNMVKRMLCDLTDPASLSTILNKCQEQLNGIIGGLGVEVTQIMVRELKVHKQGESQAVSLFNTLMKSELGAQVMGTLGSHLKDYISTVPSNGNGTVNESVMPTQRDAELEALVLKIRSLCDESLTAKVNKYYRIHCVDSTQGKLINTKAPPIQLGIDLDLRRGTPGWCGWSVNNPNISPDVTFTLQKETLVSLVNGTLSPLTAYISGDITITGSVDDAVGLKHLAERASGV